MVFLAPDKGKGIVIVDKNDYREAALTLLDDPSYTRVKCRRKYPVDKLQQQVNSMLKEIKRDGLMSDIEMKRLTVSNPTIPPFSCLPKIHKEGNKYRPVASNIKSPTSKISEWIVRNIRCFKPPHSMSIRNSFDLVKDLQDITIEDDEILVSCDVANLYPSVPRREALDIFKEWVNDQDISDDQTELINRLIEIVDQQRWIEFESEIFEQKEGLMKGNPLACQLAELFMGYIETQMSKNIGFRGSGGVMSMM